MFGVTAARLSAAMAMPLSLPPSICAAAPAPSVVAIRSTWPAMVALIAGAPPWYGIGCTGNFASCLKKYSATIWEPVPTPGMARLMVRPPIALMKLGRSFARFVGLVTSASGLDAAMAIVCEFRTDWNAERSEGTQTFPQAARRKIQEDTQLRGECATCGVKQMNGKRLNLKVCQDDPQRTVIYRVGTLVVQNASHTQALGRSPNSRLGGGH